MPADLNLKITLSAAETYSTQGSRLSVCSQIMWFHSHVMWFWESSYSQLIWFQNADIIGQDRLCSQSATATAAAQSGSLGSRLNCSAFPTLRRRGGAQGCGRCPIDRSPTASSGRPVLATRRRAQHH